MNSTRTIIGLLSLVVVGLTLANGCASQDSGKGSATPGATPASGHFAHVAKTGGQIWAENCSRCHNPRPATQYSPQQWDIIDTHMRLRANLNGEEQRAVVRFMSGT
jgi:hypothetical protein